jgi:hypothetical protein
MSIKTNSTGTGVIFNGVEMKKGEYQKDYIERVLNEMDLTGDSFLDLTVLKDESSDEEIKQEINDDSSDESISDNTSSDDSEIDDSEIDEDYLNSLGLTYFKKVMLGTYDCSIEEHDAVINWFNMKYDTQESGSNGSKGHYWTHGIKPYNLFKMKHLKSLYDRKINNVSHMNVKIHITFKDPTTSEIQEITEYTNILNNFRSQRDNDRYIELKDCEQFMNLLEFGEVEEKRDYNHQKSTNGHIWKIGDIIFDYRNPHLKYICFWKVIKITSKMLKIKALNPFLTIKHNSHNGERVLLMKYKKDVFIDDVKSKYVHKNTHNMVYIIDDYYYRMFKES